MITLETLPGDNFINVAKKAKAVAITKQAYVGFNFNGIECRVDEDTNLDWLWRDYHNAHTMDWEKVGPFCDEEYTAEVQAELDWRQMKRAEEMEAVRKAYALEEKAARLALETKLKGVKVMWSDIDAWNKSLEANAGSGYGLAAIEYAESWAKLMQLEIEKGKTVQECYQEVQSELDFMGITGFMYGCAVTVLASAWAYGEELRKAHNNEYGHDGEGTVNPAVFSIRH